MEDEVNKSEKSGEKQKLETKIEKAQLYLDKVKIPQNRNFIELDQPKKPITLDVIQELNKKLELTPEDNFYVAEEVLARKDEEGVITIENESEIFLQRHLIKTETVVGSLSGGATGLVSGVVADKILNSETVKIKSEVKGCLEDYKIIMEEKSCSCQAIIDNEASTSGEKEKSQAQKESYDNEVREIEAYIENNLK
ncbi:1742_t:CDS:2 [Paraglomus occultum]|uniref:1742_t:CDS:1 n=1 Tax=Paraglomus occultum TaxID=144539 RepID=A0A9N9AP78_9GLOM|nr:1742_t:CDS:2 [Paraglomus occultum]